MGLVQTLANGLHTTIVDRTGMTGRFDFTLDPGQLATAVDGNNSTQPPTESYIDLVLIAVREQLGLKLEK